MSTHVHVCPNCESHEVYPGSGCPTPQYRLCQHCPEQPDWQRIPCPWDVDPEPLTPAPGAPPLLTPAAVEQTGVIMRAALDQVWAELHPAPAAPLAAPTAPAPGRCPICRATVPTGQVYCQEEGDLIDGHTSLECQDTAHEHCTGRWIDTGHILHCACECHAHDPQTPAAREAAQGAVEAELDNTRCYECGADVTWRDAHIDTDGHMRCTPCHCKRGWQPLPARADEAELQAGLLATLPPMAGGAPTPADEPAGPGATAEAARCDHCGALRDRWNARHVCYYAHRCALCEPDRDEEALCAPMSASTTAPTVTATGATRGAVAGPSTTAAPTAACAAIAQAPEHTHPCPTCHQARPCTGTGCADGPRECNTCANCRGW